MEIEQATDARATHGVANGEPQIVFLDVTETGIRFKWVSWPERWRGADHAIGRNWRLFPIAAGGWRLGRRSHPAISPDEKVLYGPGDQTACIPRPDDCALTFPASEPLTALTSLIAAAAEKWRAEEAEARLKLELDAKLEAARCAQEQRGLYGTTKPKLINTTQEAVDALDESILHWERNAGRALAGRPMKTGAYACALCQLFVLKAGCGLCPVELDGRGCESSLDTPWQGHRTHPSAMLSYLRDLRSRCRVRCERCGDLGRVDWHGQVFYYDAHGCYTGETKPCPECAPKDKLVRADSIKLGKRYRYGEGGVIFQRINFGIVAKPTAVPSTAAVFHVDPGGSVGWGYPETLVYRVEGE